MPQRSFRFSDEANKKFDELSNIMKIQNPDITQSQLLEKIIMEYQPQEDCDDSVGADCQKKKNDVDIPAGLADDDRELLRLIKYIANDNNKKLFILSEVFNSLISTALHCFPERFKSTTNPKEVHDWFLQADDTLQKVLRDKVTNKKLRGE